MIRKHLQLVFKILVFLFYYDYKITYNYKTKNGNNKMGLKCRNGSENKNILKMGVKVLEE